MRAERPPSYDDRAEIEDPPPPRRWGRFLFLFALAVVLVGGGAWAWLVHGKRMTALLAGGGGDGVPVVRADPTPSKIRPRDPGGMEVPDRDKLVYERLQGEGTETRVERLLPPAEAPMRPPRAAPASDREQNERRGPESSVLRGPEPRGPEPRGPAPQVKEALPRVPTEAQVRAALPPPPPALELSKAASDREPAPEDSPPTDVETAPASPLAGAQGTTAVPPPVSPPAPPSVSERAAAPPPARPDRGASFEARGDSVVRPPTGETARPAPAKTESSAEPASGYLIQIAAVREPERAEAEWERLLRQHPETLRGLKLFVARVDLGDKGVFWRLRAGPFPDETAAKNRCAELARRKVGCLVVKAQG